VGEKGNVAAAPSVVERAGSGAAGLTGAAVTKSVEVVVEEAITRPRGSGDASDETTEPTAQGGAGSPDA
jgi:hypothetical protein